MQPGRPLNQRFAALAVRIASTVGGALILYHEVAVSADSEPFLVFVGLWLAGAPIADLLDKLRRLAMSVREQAVPEPPSVPSVNPELRGEE